MTAPDLDPAVIAAAKVVHDFACDRRCNVETPCWWCWVDEAQQVVEAVAPLIAAAALRDAANEARYPALGHEAGGHTTAYSVRRWLRARADALAPVSKEDQS